ncbi:MAG: sigma 54-interacting transcriptional regulator [Halioglobus sp.]
MTHESTVTSPDTDLTLPSVVSAKQGVYARNGLFLTVLFHPDVSRIGQVARVPVEDPAMPWVLGRRSPAFAHPVPREEQGQEKGEPLHDPHVSRRSVVLAFDGETLQLNRFSGSSRVRIAGTELHETLTLGPDALKQGVPVSLGHAVVLYLHMSDSVQLPSIRYPGSERLLGGSAAMQKLHQQIRLAAQSADDVLIRGETGTGKELVANAIHAASEKAAGPMVSVNMAAIPVDLAPSMLFGSAKGAFTGADKHSIGYFEKANGGTLFLDEIGDCPTAIQPQLLRALQQREIQEVGGAVREVDVRIVSATDAPLEGAEHFKAALLHRLGSFEILVPPLRERIEDVGLLLMHFATAAARDARQEALLLTESSSAVDVAAWAVFVFQASRYQWPGNVRELANVVGQVIRKAPEPLALVEVFESMISHRAAPGPEVYDQPGDEESRQKSSRKMADIGDEEFDLAMHESDFEPSGVARKLDVSRTAVYRRIEASPTYRLANEIPVAELRQLLGEGDDGLEAVARRLKVSSAGLRLKLRAIDNDSR